MESKGIDQNIQPTAPKPVERWNYDNHFREYLLLLASKGNIALESSTRYPESIELSKSWHQTLNQMRNSTKADGKEKWILAGVKEERRSIFLPTLPATGQKDHVPAETIKKMENWATDKHGIVDILGDIHSHPTDLITNLGHKFILGNKRKLVEVFSAGDLYALVVRHYKFMGVTAGNYNIFAFKTKESKSLEVNPLIFNQESFEKYWYEKYGFKYLGGVEKFGAKRVMQISDAADSTKMNLAIAKRHGLVLYQGEADKDLVKIFPQ